MKQTQRIFLEKIDHRLIVLKSNVVGELFQSLPQKLVLLFFENVRNIQLLQFLIGEVYKELFERVYLEDLKTKYVQQTNALPECFIFVEIHFLDLDLFVELCDEEEESLFEEIFGERVLKSHCLLILQGRIDDVDPYFSGFVLETLRQPLELDPKQSSHVRQILLIDDNCHLLVALGKFFPEGQIPQVQHCRNNRKHTICFFRSEVVLKLLMDHGILILISDSFDLKN
jgi:hypothetical protein